MQVGVPTMAQWDWQYLESTETQVPSLAWHRGLRYWCCCSCIAHNCSLDLISGQGIPYAVGWPKKKKKEKKERKKKMGNCWPKPVPCSLLRVQRGISTAYIPHSPRHSQNDFSHMLASQHLDSVSCQNYYIFGLACA